MSFSGKWMELKIIMLSEISWSHKVKYSMFSLMVGTRGKQIRMKQNKTPQCHVRKRGTTRELGGEGEEERRGNKKE
jgi:hypothetical protein